MLAKVTVAEADAVILRLLHAVRVSAAAEVRAAVRAEAAREVHRVRVGARVSVREVERVIARDRVGVATGTVIHPAKVTAAAPEANTPRVQAAEATHPYPSPAKAQVVPVRASPLIRLPRGREKKRRANRTSQNTRIHKI